MYGYFPCVSEGNDLIVLTRRRARADPVHLPAAAARPAALPGRLLPRPRELAGETDVVAFQLVTMGPRVAEATAELFAENAYRDYLELHGLSVQLTEALAECGTRGCARSSASAPRTTRTSAASCGRATAGRATRSATPPAPTSRTGPSSSGCWTRSRIGVVLSEELQLHPEQSTDALVVHHPEAKYFNAT